MRTQDFALAKRLDTVLEKHDATVRKLPGIGDLARRATFIEQLVESERRIRYFNVLAKKTLSFTFADPTSDLFDPIKGALVLKQRGELEEAFWLLFYAVHFGKNQKGGWRYAREVYGALGSNQHWNWENTSRNPSAFRAWLASNEVYIGRTHPTGGFNNHRKYQSLSATSNSGTGAAFETYIEWIGPNRGHVSFINEVLSNVQGNSNSAFDSLYRSMQSVLSFGRLARFDYLCMVGKIGLAPISPGSTYMANATGPVSGARLLYGKNPGNKELDNWLISLDKELNVGMQVIEDALCNWQKSPTKFIAFRG
jgi:hypothetical protein